jgi:hypothetical protein
MSEAEDFHALRQRYEAFNATELGRLYRAYDHAMIDYWRRDMDEELSRVKFMALQKQCREATNAFVAKLMEIAGV